MAGSSTGARSSGARCTRAAPNGCYDAETVALDEFGHIEGLGHHVNFADDRDYTDAVVQTFSRTKPRDGYNMHVLGVCDVARLQIRYDTQHASFPYSTCLDLPTKLSLSGNDTTAAVRRDRDLHGRSSRSSPTRTTAA